MPPTELKLEAVPVPQYGSKEKKVGGEKRVFDCAAVDAESKAYPMGQDVVKDTLDKEDWERAGVFHCVCLGAYLDVESFGVLFVKYCGYCNSNKGLIYLIACGAYNQKDIKYSPLRLLV